MSTERHIADAEHGFVVINVNPDFCRVHGSIVPFDIVQTLEPELADYARTVTARDAKVLLADSFIRGVEGNAGAGKQSTVSLEEGHVRIVGGSSTVWIEDRSTARHLDLCEMNVKVEP